MLQLTSDQKETSPPTEVLQTGLLDGSARPILFKDDTTSEGMDHSSSINQNDTIAPLKKNIFKGRKHNYYSFCNNLVTNYCCHIECNHTDTDEGKELIKAM